MRVIPPEVIQPEGISEKPSIINDLPYKEQAILVNSNTNLVQSEKPLVSQKPPEDIKILISNRR